MKDRPEFDLIRPRQPRGGSYAFLLLVVIFVLIFLATCNPRAGGVTPPEATLEASAPLPGVTPVATPVPTLGATPMNAAPSANATATLTLPAAANTLATFIQGLELVIAARDFVGMQGLMSDPFAIGYWRSEGVTLPPPEAVTALERFLPPNATILFEEPGTDISAQLDNQPAASLVNGQKLAAALLTHGWGADGRGEVILFIVEQPDGGYRWALALLAANSFMTNPTDVTGVTIAAEQATLHAGPGINFPVVATVFGGMPFPVIGVSDDGEWWRLTCFDDRNRPIPGCWVAADPAISAPATLP